MIGKQNVSTDLDPFLLHYFQVVQNQLLIYKTKNTLLERITKIHKYSFKKKTRKRENRITLWLPILSLHLQTLLLLRFQVLQPPVIHLDLQRPISH